MRLLKQMIRTGVAVAALLTVAASAAFAQGVTSAALTGVVKDDQGGVVPGATIVAVHQPSGSTYTAVSQGDGRYTIAGMRVGGPYTISAELPGFVTAERSNVTLSLGVTQDVSFDLRVAAVSETVQVVAESSPIFSSGRTGAATAVTREDLATLPTVSARISDITRLTPQASGSSFAGQDNRLNNITVDGSYFNNSFGLGGEPGARTNVAPISLESLEQVQVSVAPYDVRQGSFIGAAVNTVTRSGTNSLRASVYHRMRNDGWVGTEAAGNTVNPGTFTFRNTGGWAGGPILKNRLFAFGTYENEEDKRPLTTFLPNSGGQPVGGAITRVLSSDLDTLAAFLKNRFNYDPGTYVDLQDLTPAKRYLLRTDFNLTNQQKVSFRYNQLDSSSANYPSGSSSAGIGRPTFTQNYLAYSGSTYDILENIKSGIGEVNSMFGSLANNLIIGYTSNDESRGDIGKLFPFVDILQDGVAMTSFGSEAFSVQNELRYKTFQFQDSLTKFSDKHTITVGASVQRYHSDNVFWSCCPQSSYAYNSLEDFYTDANDYLANPNRTVSPVSLRFFKVRYSNVPDLDKPLQPLTVWYNGAYAQDEWRPRTDLTITAGIRADVSLFDQSGYTNPKADALTFRSQDGSPIQFSTGELPETKVLWSPRVAMNWDVQGQQRTQVRAGTGLFTGPPLYVWISNQLGNSGVLIGEIVGQNTTAFPFNPDPNRYKPATVTGAGASSFELNVTDRDFKFPQVWRTNLGVDQKLPGGVVGTVEFLYNKDVNGTAYYNANLPAAQTAFTGVDNRPRWTSNRLNNTSPNIITNAVILTNQGFGRSWNISGSLSKAMKGLTLRTAYSYGQSRNAIDAGSTAFSSFANNQHSADPNNPGLGRSAYTQGHRVFVNASYSREYFSFGSTSVSVFWEARPSNQNFSNVASYVFNGDMNGDGANGNDLIYIPRDASEMNFVQFTTGGRTFTPAEQAAAFEAYIQQDPYLKDHRGEYAKRGGLNMAMFNRADLSIVQDVFKNIGGKRNAAQVRLDISNFSNLLNRDWGVSKRLVLPTTGANGAQILTNAAADAQGRASYRMAVVNGELVRNTFQGNTGLGDVYQIMLSFRYSFN